MNKVHYAEIDDHAHAIGYVCITWAVLETELDKIITVLSPLEMGDVSEAILGNSNIRDKVKMLKALGFMRKPDDKWYDELEQRLNLIDQEFRIKRNQYIHDLWINQVTFESATLSPGSQVAKRTRGAKVVNVQSRTKKLSLFKDVPTKASEIWNFANAIRDVGMELSILLLHYRAFLDTKALEEERARALRDK